MIKGFSLAALAALVMVGCNSGGNGMSTESPTSGVSTYSEAEKLAYAIGKKGAVLKSASTPKSKSSKSRVSIPCDSGTMEVLFSIPVTQLTENSEPNEFVFNHCKQGDETLNGGMKMDFDMQGNPTRMSFPDGFSVTGGDEPGSVTAGGYMDIVQDGEWEVATINLEMNINGVKHGGQDLVYRSKDLADGTSIEYPVSGKEKIGDSSYFTVDPAYDASATPFTTNAQGALLSGLFKYIDGSNHDVELEITATDIVTVRVDEDGNGAFSDTEVSSISLK